MNKKLEIINLCKFDYINKIKDFPNDIKYCVEYLFNILECYRNSTVFWVEISKIGFKKYKNQINNLIKTYDDYWNIIKKYKIEIFAPVNKIQNEIVVTLEFNNFDKIIIVEILSNNYF